MRTAAALLLLAALLNAASNAHGADAKTLIQEVAVRSSRVHTKDVLKGVIASASRMDASKEIDDVDLGPTPAIGSSRVIDRAEIERAYVSAGITPPKRIPAAIRVSRKTRRLGSAEVVSAIKTALAEKPLPRGASVTSIRAPLGATEIADDFQHVSVELPSVPRRAGPVTVQAVVTFLGDGDMAIHKSIVPIELALPQTAALSEIPKGAPITLVVRHGLVEVSIGAVSAIDADVGSILPVTIKPSGRVIRARAIDKDHAIALEDS